MRIVDVHDANAHFSSLLESVAAGETILIASSGTPIAKLAPMGSPASPRRIGFRTGRITIPDDFDRMHSEEIARFQ